MGPGIAYSRIVRLRSGPDVILPSLGVECDLCSHWEHPHPLSYTFHIRPALWHNIPPVGGRSLTAQDVVFSIDRVRTPGWPGASLLQAIESVEATDNLAVTIRLKYPDTDFLVALANGQIKIVPPEAVRLGGDLQHGPTIGTGPWVLVEDNPTQLLFEAYHAYYEPGLPRLRHLRVVPISGGLARLAAFLTGQIDLTTLNPEEWQRLQKMGTAVHSGTFPQPGTGLLLGLKASTPPFDDTKTRQAIFQALDPWRAIDSVWQGHGNVTIGVPLASHSWLLSKEEMGNYLANHGRIKPLMANSRATQPVTFELTVADYGDKYLAMGEEYELMLRKAGFKPTLRLVSPRVYAEKVWSQGSFQAFLGPMPPVHSPNAFLFSILHSEGSWSGTGYFDRELDRLIEEQSIAQNKRSELMRNIQRYVMDKAILFMPVSGTSLWVWHEQVAGFNPNFAGSEYFHWARLRVNEE
ncbi:ABC transporter substrate-binding protein [Dehalococcoidia bacterium]|nr:ABC transporter substrate-binding protein [Dehalococcoidia bacterium]